MKDYLIIGISNAEDLTVFSTRHKLKNQFDQTTAQQIIENEMGCEVDRVLIVRADEQYPPAIVVNDFNAKD